MSFQTEKPMAEPKYKAEWKTIDSLEQQGLPRSALEKVIVLHERAKKDNEPAQVIKTLVYRSKYEIQLEENGLVKVINKLETEAEKAKAPVNAFLYSLLGELYQSYLLSNYWQISNRTTTINFAQEDIATWSAEQLQEKSSWFYWQSLKAEKDLDIPVEQFDAITTEGRNTDVLRPTLYDLLIHRAIDHFMNERSYLTAPAYQFTLSEDQDFSDASAFANETITAKDTSSFKYQTILLFQKAIKHHLKDRDPAALIDVDLKRLKFVYQNSVNDLKDSLYLEALQDWIKKYPKQASIAEVQYAVASYYFGKGRNYQAGGAEEDRWLVKKAKEICDQTIVDFPNSYGAKHCQVLLQQIMRKDLSMKAETVSLPNRPALALLQYRNIFQVFVKVLKITEEEREELNYLKPGERINKLNAKRPILNWQETLPDPADYHEHSAEIQIDPLPVGYYAVMISPHPSFGEAHQYGLMYMHVSQLGYFTRRTEDRGIEIVVMDRESGAPLSNVQAEFYKIQYNRQKQRNEQIRIGRERTDQDGKINYKTNSNNFFRIKLIQGEDQLYTDQGYSSYTSTRNRRKNQFTEFFLDRAIYRPGQTIYFKGIALEKDEKGHPRILTNEPIVVTFYDVNRQEVTNLELFSNEYGTIQGQFTAPKSGLLGSMSIQSSLGNSTKSFQVEEYKRPKFEVTFPALEGQYKLGDSVTITGNAKAYAGSNIDGAKVQYRVVREVRYPWRPWWLYRRIPSRSQQVEIANGVLTTDVDGTFEVTFAALPDRSVDPSQKPSFHFTLFADVTDITGETHSNQKNISLGYIDLMADVQVVESQDRQDTLMLGLSTTNLDGAFQAARGTLKVFLLDSPDQVFIDRYWKKPDIQLLPEEKFKNSFPHFAYAQEDEKHSWETTKEVFNTDFDTKNQQKYALNTKTWEVGHYLVVLESADSKGEKIEVRRHFVLYDVGAKSIPANLIEWHQLNQSTYQPGEILTLALASNEGPLHVLLEREHQQQITASNWIRVNQWESIQQNIVADDLGNFHYHLAFVKYNRSYIKQELVMVPWNEKDLKIEYSSFRDKLRPGQEEEWRIKISGHKNEKVAAEMVAAMYDASLDAFAPNNWGFNPYPQYNYAYQGWNPQSFSSLGMQVFQHYGNLPTDFYDRSYRQLKWFNLLQYAGGRRNWEYAEDIAVRGARSGAVERESVMNKSAVVDGIAMESSAFAMDESDENAPAPPPSPPAEETKDQQSGAVPIRTNLNETVFFLPDLMTDSEGNVIIKFIMNEALTRWKFLGLAHTKDLKFATTENIVVTQKELMVMPNPPRFVREGDQIEFTAKVSNLTEKELAGTASLELFDALSQQPVNEFFGLTENQLPFTTQGGQSARLAWKLKVPHGKVVVLTHRVVAQAGEFSDGEESALPVLTNRILVTESLPLPVAGKETKNFTFHHLAQADESATLQHHNLSLEFTSNPAWYAVKALPYLMEYPYDCSEQIFNRFYANSLATSVAEAHPNIKAVFESWKQSGGLKSNLMQNQELKSALLEETPWVVAAQSEEQQRQNIGLLFDLNRMSDEQAVDLAKLAERQQENGGFAWFAGGRESWYISQYIVEGLGHLDHLKVKKVAADPIAANMTRKAIGFIDQEIIKHYRKLEENVAEKRTTLDKDHLDHLVVHYLYARSFFLNHPIDKELQQIHKFYLEQAEKYWLEKGLYQQGMIGLALNRFGEKTIPANIVKSLKERALQNEELGMYWKYPGGYFWHQLPIETHTMLMELFAEVDGDQAKIDALKVWLLKHKQTTHWKTTKATAAAVYALLKYGDNWLLEDQPVKVSFPQVSKKVYADKIEQAQAQAEAGTGYFKTSWEGKATSSKFSEVKVKNTNKTVAWGSVYWQYFEDLDKVSIFKETPLKLDKKLFLEVPSDKGPVLQPIDETTTLQPGDKIQVRIELRVDRDMEYVHMKDMRASGLEPINVISRYKWQGGLGYYESTGDVATNFFFSYLSKGTYVFEYPLRVNHKGDFSNGLTTIQCMYAPEFTSHSEGVRISVE